jgi:tetratricopeptide (TPR) repeat protein
MTKRSRKKASQLSIARKEYETAQSAGIQTDLSLAAANLGLALFQAKKFKDGEKSFHEAEEIAIKLDDAKLLVRGLGLSVLANQLTGRLPTAYKIAQQIETIADQHDDQPLKADSLSSQGQILIESGDELTALEKLNAAQAVLETLDDPRRQMNLAGAFGNYSMTIAAPEKAQAYFEQARDLAQQIEDRPSEIGFHGNIGTILEWQGDFHQAGDIFKDVLAYVTETGNQSAQIQALRHLVQVNEKLKDDAQLVEFAEYGVVLAAESGDQNIFNFYEKLIQAYYRLEQFDEAHQATQNAIATAQDRRDRNQEVSLLLSLGESYMLTNEWEAALVVYQQALDGTQRLQRLTDQAYLLGRIGIILAELERTDEALDFHQQAIKQAQRHEIVELEAEQSIMIAMAFFDKGDLAQAQTFCQRGIETYSTANLHDEAHNARQLLAEIEASNT